MKIGLAITGSFCTHAKIIPQIEKLKENGYDILPIVTPSVETTDTRFGTANEFIKKLEEITENKIIDSIVSAEPIGPKNLVDIIVVAPCTGNTLAKIANSITDNAVTMAVKSHIRNNKPLVIAISTNDALGLNLKNIATLANTKNIFFVPFGQDEPIKKPKSLISDLSLLLDTIDHAMKGEQIQPMIIKYQ